MTYTEVVGDGLDNTKRSVQVIEPIFVDRRGREFGWEHHFEVGPYTANVDGPVQRRQSVHCKRQYEHDLVRARSKPARTAFRGSVNMTRIWIRQKPT